MSLGGYALIFKSTTFDNISAEQLMRFVADSACRVVITDQTSENNYKIKHLQENGIEILSVEDTNTCLNVAEQSPSCLVRNPNWLWGIIYSSGTTGCPKGIVRSDFSILTELLGWCIELPTTRNTTFYIGRPLYYTGGLVLATSTILVGGTVISPTEHTPDIYWDICKKWNIDYAFFIPEQVSELLRNAVDKEKPLV